MLISNKIVIFLACLISYPPPPERRERKAKLSPMKELVMLWAFSDKYLFIQWNTFCGWS
jgi:hypothetical protein